MRVLTCASALLLLSAPVFAQEEIARRQAVELATRERVALEKSMKGAPYSAEAVIESTQTLADGNRISKKTTGLVYRDSEGRTRREEDVTITAKTATGIVTSPKKTISIVDPVGGYSYSLDPENKIAWQTPMGGAGTILRKVEEAQVDAAKRAMLEKLMAERKAGAGDEQSKTAADEEKMKAAAAGGGGARARVGGGGGGGVVTAGGGGRGGFARSPGMTPDAPLEHKTIDGIAVEGRKTTTVIPAGQVGNEQPITITSEEWRSVDLNLLVLTKHSDPRTGESTYRLQNIVRAEPDRSLFMVPSDYTVRETGIRKMEEAALRKY